MSTATKPRRCTRPMLSDAKLKVKDIDAEASADPGWIEGYASAFGNLDAYREVVRPGAFAKTIEEKVAAGDVPFMIRHWAYGGETADVIGSVSEAKEDEYGLWTHSSLSSVTLAQETRQKAIEGHIKKMSIGYVVVQSKTFTWEDGEPAVELTELSLTDVVVTVFPVNELAVITAAKAFSDAVAAIKGKRGMPADELHAADVRELLVKLDALGKELQRMLAAGEPPPPDAPATPPDAKGREHSPSGPHTPESAGGDPPDAGRVHPVRSTGIKRRLTLYEV